MADLQGVFGGPFQASRFQRPAPSSLTDRDLAFRDALERFGIVTNGALVSDGEIHRLDDASKPPRNKDAWYVLHHYDNFSAGAFGSWVQAQGQSSWCSRDPDTLTAAERASLAAAHERAKHAAAEAHKIAAETAALTVDAAHPAPASHPYLLAKRISPNGALLYGDRLLLPARDLASTIQTYQTIAPDGSKLFLKGAAKKGASFLIGSPNSGLPLYVTEGFATGATVHEATGAAVYVAFDRTNLRHVVAALRKQTSAPIVLAADDDQWTLGNPGLADAKAVAAEYQAVTVRSPRFASLDGHPTDFNDLAAREGLATVKAQLALSPDAGGTGFRLLDWTANRYQGAAPEIRWLCQDAVPLGVPVLFAAMGGLGKSYLALDLALSIAVGVTNLLAPKNLLGGRVVAQGTAVILSAEDSRDSIHRRLEAIDPERTRLKAPERLIVVPMPDAGGPRPLIANDGKHLAASPFFRDLLAQLRSLSDLRLVVIDPLQAFVLADVNADPAAGQFMWSAFAEICAVTGATVIAAHHMKKEGSFAVETADQAREAIRGSTALVDGARLVYALWKTKEDRARALCNETDLEFEDGRVVSGAVVKANDKATKTIQTYLRQPSGVLANLMGFKLDKARRGMALSRSQIEQLVAVVETRFLTDSPFSAAQNSGARWLGRYLMREFELRRSVATELLATLLDQQILVEEMVDSHTKKMGLKAVKQNEWGA